MLGVCRPAVTVVEGEPGTASKVGNGLAKIAKVERKIGVGSVDAEVGADLDCKLLANSASMVHWNVASVAGGLCEVAKCRAALGNSRDKDLNGGVIRG